jgi:hypothetical protein
VAFTVPVPAILLRHKSQIEGMAVAAILKLRARIQFKEEDLMDMMLLMPIGVFALIGLLGYLGMIK